MTSFLAAIWSPDDPAALRRVRALQADPELMPRKAFGQDRSGLWLADLSRHTPAPRILPAGVNGAVYGTLFRRSAAPGPVSPVEQFTDAEACSIAATSGDGLLRDFWGSYIAILETARGYTVLADPATSIPCFYFRAEGITYVFSHLERCPAALRKPLRVNRQFVSKLLAYDKIQNGETGLSGVRELRAGYSLRLGAGGPDEVLSWDPRGFASAPLPSAVRADDAAEELGDTIRHVVLSRARAAPRIVLHLSGGLDSAIVAASLRSAALDSDIHALHQVPAGGDPSEAEFARSLAESFGLGLTELVLDPAAALPGPHLCPASARPFREFLGQSQLALQAMHPDLAGRTPFTGQGGDHLFQEVRTPLGLADYLLLNGLQAGTLHQLASAARLSGLSVWKVLGDTLPSVLSGKPPQPAFEAGLARRRTALNRLAFDSLDTHDLLPAWASEASGLPPAKFSQVSHLVHMFQNRASLYSGAAPPQIHPLISQPLIEFWLRTPVYLLCTGGVPRGLARRAMKSRVPDLVRLRRTKGDASRYYIEHLAANRSLLSEVLMDGELTAGGFVDPADISNLLRADTFRLLTYSQMLLVCYAIECWLQRWKSEGRAV